MRATVASAVAFWVVAASATPAAWAEDELPPPAAASPSPAPTAPEPALLTPSGRTLSPGIVEPPKLPPPSSPFVAPPPKKPTPRWVQPVVISLAVGAVGFAIASVTVLSTGSTSDQRTVNLAAGLGAGTIGCAAVGVIIGLVLR